MNKKLLINSAVLAGFALALAACNDSGGDGSVGTTAQFQFGPVFSQAFGTGVSATAEPIDVTSAGLRVDPATDPSPVQ